MLRKKRLLVLISAIMIIAGVSSVLAYNYYQTTFLGGPNVIVYDPNGQVSYATGWDMILHRGTLVQLDVIIKSGTGPLNVQFSDINATHVYVNSEHISASKSWTFNIDTEGRHQLHMDNLDPVHQIVTVTVKVTQK